MARLFISILGTSNYEACTYKLNGLVGTRDTRFVQEVTAAFSCKNWSGEDRILIFTTPEAESKNWLDDGHTDKETRKPIIQEGLRSRLASLKLQPDIKNISIPEGKNEDEIWEIFWILFNEINHDDEIVFDITHSFRSLPMLVLVVLNYAKVLKKVSLKGIYYGAFEAARPLAAVVDKNRGKRIVPIFDLGGFDVLLDWTVAIGVFMRSGDATLAADLAARQTSEVLKKTKGADAEAKNLKLISHLLADFTKDVSTCRGLRLSDDIKKLKDSLAQFKGANMSSPFNPLLDQLSDRLKVFDGDPIKDGIRIAEWCAEHNLIQQGYTILRECLINYVCKGYRIDFSNFEERVRIEENIGKDLSMWHECQQPKRKGGSGKIGTPLLCIFQGKLDLLKVFDQLFGLRNDINHAGMRRNPGSAKTLTKELRKLISKVRKLLLE